MKNVMLLLAAVLIAGCASNEPIPTPNVVADAATEVGDSTTGDASSDAMGCVTSTDCVALTGPCQVYDGGTVCPVASCVEGQCQVTSSSYPVSSDAAAASKATTKK